MIPTEEEEEEAGHTKGAPWAVERAHPFFLRSLRAVVSFGPKRRCITARCGTIPSVDSFCVPVHFINERDGMDRNIILPYLTKHSKSPFFFQPLRITTIMPDKRHRPSAVEKHHNEKRHLHICISYSMLREVMCVLPVFHSPFLQPQQLKRSSWYPRKEIETSTKTSKSNSNPSIFMLFCLWLLSLPLPVKCLLAQSSSVYTHCHLPFV